MRAAPWIILYVTAKHLVWFGLSLFSTQPFLTTPLSFLHPLNDGPASWTLGVVAFTGGMGLLWGARFRPYGILLFAPQQALCILAAGSAVTAAISGHYPDGTIRPLEFILADQTPLMLTAVFHTLALYERATQHG